MSPPVDTPHPKQVRICLDRATPIKEIPQLIPIATTINRFNTCVNKRAIITGNTKNASIIKIPTALKALIEVAAV